MRRAAGQTLAELLIVVGVLALLVALLLPPLQVARNRASRAQCAANLQAIGRALEMGRTEFKFYPYWDDRGSPIRYTWIDVLTQRSYLGRAAGGEQRLGYCPLDERPDPENSARNANLMYPSSDDDAGVDYSYGIGVPLSAGGWAWQQWQSANSDSHRFSGHERGAANRLLAADAYDSRIFNLSGGNRVTRAWNAPTQFDNTVAWQRHDGTAYSMPSSNVLFQDGHVNPVFFEESRPEPVNTVLTYVWQAGEDLNVNAESMMDDRAYPHRLPPNPVYEPLGNLFPREMIPAWYTRNRGWDSVVK